ncbi:hypothetical protein K7X08_015262 [Anisodus acutangulus]|uniref:Serine-threonine/tyrosine-protein kinase catalytic domain-containing protein n=1 Tax=Anisodus acutangulus TaxID=402998 RepID=A0A9Q1L342_9SOLA|nr:hypothetical protein K7X08_015262 [Anisodus acutangulus]
MPQESTLRKPWCAKHACTKRILSLASKDHFDGGGDRVGIVGSEGIVMGMLDRGLAGKEGKVSFGAAGKGYMSPEYAMKGHFLVKSDVFSFGVLLLEIITGRKNTIHYQDHSLNLVGYVWDSWNDDKALDVVNPSLGHWYETGEVLRCIQIGLLCVQSFSNDRPMISEVVFMLFNETKLVDPGQPGFVVRSRNSSSLPYSSSASVETSVNDISITAHQTR